MKKIYAILLISTLSISLLACGNTGNGQEAKETTTPKVTTETPTEEVKETPTTEEMTTEETTEQKKDDKTNKSDKIAFKDDDGNELKFVKSEKTKDYNGNTAIGIYFNYSNNTQKAQTPMFAISVKAFQNGIECESAILTETSKEYQNSVKEIKPGASLDVCWYFSLDGDSDVEIEVSPLIDFTDNNLATQTIKIK